MSEHVAAAHVAHLLPAFVGGTLDAIGRAGVEAHLAGCSACQAELAAWQVIQRAARETFDHDAPAIDDILQRVWRRIDTAADHSQPLPTPLFNVIEADRPASSAPARRFLPPTPLRRSAAHLATAALLLLTLVASFLAFGPGRPGRDDDAQLLIPAISGTPATPAAVTTRTLLDTVIAALPTGRQRVVVDRWRLQPSPAAVTLPARDGLVMMAVDAGEVAVTADEIEHQLPPGHAIDVTSREFSFRAAGAAPAIAYVVYVVPGMWFASNQLWLDGDPLVHAHDGVISSSADDLADGSGRLVLEELTLPPGSALPPRMASPRAWIEVGEGVLGLTLDGERLPFRWQPGMEREFHPFGRETFPLVAPGTLMTLRNAGDEPLVLYQLRIVPAAATVSHVESGGATPAPPGTAGTETLLDTTLDELPVGHAILGVRNWTLRPASQPLTVPPRSGPAIFMVETGAVAATVNGTNRQLTPGQHLFLTGDMPASFRADGAEAATVLEIFALTSFTAGGRALGESGGDDLTWNYDQTVYTAANLIAASPNGLPGGPVRLLLDRMILPPGSALQPEAARPLTWTEVGAGVLGLTLEGERLPFRWRSGDERSFRHGQQLPPIQPGTTLTLRNAGDEPLVLYRLAIVPDNAGTPRAAAPTVAPPRPP